MQQYDGPCLLSNALLKLLQIRCLVCLCSQAALELYLAIAAENPLAVEATLASIQVHRAEFIRYWTRLASLVLAAIFINDFFLFFFFFFFLINYLYYNLNF